MESTQIWKPIPGYVGLYEASDDGQVRTLRAHPKGRNMAGHVLKQSVHANGYANVGLRKDGRRKVVGVHRLVAMAFHGMPGEREEACHADGDKLNNSAGNLRWGTHTDNVQDTVRAGRHFSFGASKTHCKNGHEFTQANTFRATYGDVQRRICRACRSDAARRYRMRRDAA